LSYFVIAEALEGSLFVSHIASVVFEKRETASQLSGEGLFAKVRIRHDASSYKVRMPCLACIHGDHAEQPPAEALCEGGSRTCSKSGAPGARRAIRKA
jgi:hypothetical protein